MIGLPFDRQWRVSIFLRACRVPPAVLGRARCPQCGRLLCGHHVPPKPASDAGGPR